MHVMKFITSVGRRLMNREKRLNQFLATTIRIEAALESGRLISSAGGPIALQTESFEDMCRDRDICPETVAGWMVNLAMEREK